MKAFFLLCSTGLAVLLLVGCETPGKSPSTAFAPITNFTTVATTAALDPALLRPGDALFALGPGDRVEIEILNSPNTRAVTFVGPDGKIYYHLLPGLDVWGLTLGQTRDRLEKELAKYLAQPQVSVTLREVASRHVWLLGRLNKPGIYPIASPMTLLESMALAGGTSRSSAAEANTEELADLRHSFVMRQGQILPVDFYRLLHDGDTSQNIYLQPDDFVFVPSILAQEVYVLGAVKTPRAVPFVENMSLVSAIAGGYGPIKWDFLSRYDYGLLKDAYLSHVAVVRGSLTEPQVAIVDVNPILKGQAPDMRLEPGDIVFVPNSPYRFLKSYVNMVVNTFVSTVAANEGINAGGGTVGVGVSVPVGGR